MQTQANQTQMARRTLLAGALATLLSASPALSTPPEVASFSRIGLLSGDNHSVVRAVNSDGTKAVGESWLQNPDRLLHSMAVRWNAIEGMKILPLLQGDGNTHGTVLSGSANDITPDGTRIAFYNPSTQGPEVVAGYCTGSGSQATTLTTGIPHQISDSGTVIFGESFYLALGAFRWTAATGLQHLDPPAGFDFMQAADGGASSNGQVSVGWATSFDEDGYTVTKLQAYRWTAATGSVALGFLSGGTGSMALGCSANGGIVYGISTSAQFPGTPEMFSYGDISLGELFLWSPTTGMTALGRPSATEPIYGGGICGDASVITAGEFVGHTAPASFFEFSKILSKAGLGVVTDGWTGWYLSGISGDGNTVFGSATNPMGKTEGFIVRFPANHLRNLNNIPPVITSPLSVTATVGTLFTYQIVGSNNPTSFMVTNLPAGLSFNSALGVITGIPTQAGTSQIALAATNYGGTGSGVLRMTVDPRPNGISILNASSVTGLVERPFAFQIRVTGVTGSATITASGLPPGLANDQATGLISGTPTESGSYRVSITVRDGSQSATATFQLTISADAGLAVITSPDDAILGENTSFVYRITASNNAGVDDPTFFSISGVLPSGLVFDAQTGVIKGSYTPAQRALESSVAAGLATPSRSVAGGVQLFAHNSHGTATMPLTFLTPLPQLLNISTRVGVQSGDNVLIGGLIVSGIAPKKIILRGIGTSLGSSGLTGVLADPILELHKPDGSVIINDNWKETQEAVIRDTGIPPSKDSEAAILAVLDPGAYTAVLKGKNGGHGIGLVEAYDLDTAADSELSNISSRGFVGTADQVLIGGFIVGGGSEKVLIRAIGPSLRAVGVNDPLMDPILELYNANGGLIVADDNWKDAQEAAIVATKIPPKDEHESAVLASLPPSRYTVIVRGKANTTGVGLVEVYKIR